MVHSSVFSLLVSFCAIMKMCANMSRKRCMHREDRSRSIVEVVIPMI